MTEWITLVALAVVLLHCLRQIASLNYKKWHGHLVKFSGLALAHALIAGGAVGVALGMGVAPMLLLVGIAAKILFDRRILLP